MAVLTLLAAPGAALAQSDPPAKQVFGAQGQPSPEPPAAHGSYAQGCLAGAMRLAETGPSWQAMRLSRNRNWGHPAVIAFIERLGAQVQDLGWQGLYVGDISQPRGGPMRTGHRSHQIGLDVDIWLRPPSGRQLSRAERERIGSPSVVSGTRVNANWTPRHHAVLKTAARDAQVARIFVNPAIKAELCRAEPALEAGGDRAWLNRIRPWWGHDSHFHVRLSCPGNSPGCVDQAPPPPGDGCDDTLAWWFSEEARNPKPSPKPAKPRGPVRLGDLPAACRALVGR